MDLCNNSSESNTPTGRSVVENTENSNQVIALNKMISLEKERVNLFFCEIGKAYFELHSDSYEPRFEQMIDGVLQAQAKIKAYEEQVAKINSVTNCPKCGGQTPFGSQFCGRCGARISVQDISGTTVCGNIKRCAKCGATLCKDDAFCTNCGAKIQITANYETQSESAASVVREPAVSDVRHCPNCGKAISVNAKFCIGCGSYVRG